MPNKNTKFTISNCIFSFQCKKSWDDMRLISTTSGSEVRYCSGCEKKVYQCLTDEELTRNVELNRCVAITRSSDVQDFMLLGDVGPNHPIFKNND